MIQRVIMTAIEIASWGSVLALVWCILAGVITASPFAVLSLIIFFVSGLIMTATLNPAERKAKL